MKRIVWVLFLICVLLFSVACNKGNPANTDQSFGPSTVAQQIENQENTTNTPNVQLDYKVTRPMDGIGLKEELAFAQFLTDVNYNGEYLVSVEQVAPGTVRDISLIPTAPQDFVGQSVEVAFQHDTRSLYFYYCADEVTEKERLAVIVHAKIPLLVILETNLGGAESLRNKIVTAEPFRATVLALANIDNLEPIYVQQACHSDLDDYPYLPNEFIDIFGKAPIYGIYMGKIEINSYETSTTTVHMRGNEVKSASEPLKNSLQVYEKIFKRFSLGDIMFLTQN